MKLQRYYNPAISFLNKKQESEELDKNIVFFTFDKYFDFLDKWKSSNIFALDLETYSYNPSTGKAYPYGGLDPWMSDIRLIQIGLETGEVLIIDTGGYIKPQYSQSESDRLILFWETLKTKLYDTNTEVLGHNIKFDLLCLRILGLKCLNAKDTMLMSEIYWSGVGVEKAKKGQARIERGIKGFHSLKLVAQRCGIEINKEEQTSDWSSSYLSNKQYNYAARDVTVLFEIYNYLKPRLLKEGLKYSIYAECIAIPAFVEMEFKGMPVQKQVLLQILSEYHEKKELVLENWYKYFPDQSPRLTKKDLVPLFKKVLGISVEDTSSEVLATINHEAIHSLLTYRTLEISIKYLERIKTICEISESSGYGYNARTRFRQIATNWRTASSGKISFTENGKRKTLDSMLCHNLQQIPNLSSELQQLGLKSIRSIFEVGMYQSLIIADLSQAHTRIAAEMMQDQTLLQSYNNNLDNHLLTAKRILDINGYKDWTFEVVERIYKEYKKGVDSTEGRIINKSRKEAKTGFYAFLNQAGATTMLNTFHKFGMNVTEEFCQNLLGILRETYQGLFLGIKKKIKEANKENITFEKYKDLDGNSVKGEYGIIRGLSGGRNYCLKVQNKQKTKTEVAFTDTISFMWLSTEASIMKASLGEIHIEFENNPQWKAYLCNFAHDEINAVCDNAIIIPENIELEEEWDFSNLIDNIFLFLDQEKDDDLMVTCKKDNDLEVANCVGTIIAKNMKRFIKSIPVEETNDYQKLICKNYSEK
jgi:DNA polymerase I-like protein with 3'-5' exonuclease and polymerase domains